MPWALSETVLSVDKIEHIVMNGARLSHGDINNLVSAMSALPAFADSQAVQNNPLLTAALGR